MRKVVKKVDQMLIAARGQVLQKKGMWLEMQQCSCP